MHEIENWSWVWAVFNVTFSWIFSSLWLSFWSDNYLCLKGSKGSHRHNGSEEQLKLFLKQQGPSKSSGEPVQEDCWSKSRSWWDDRIEKKGGLRQLKIKILWHSYETAALIPGNALVKIWGNGKDCQLDLV